jgi:hypothetical protein
MSVKTAQSLIEEFVRAVRPPQGCAIVLTEIVPSLNLTLIGWQVPDICQLQS